MEWPTHYSIMAYTIFPEIEDFYLKDSCQGDSPRRKQISKHGAMASSVGIIGLGSRVKNGMTVSDKVMIIVRIVASIGIVVNLVNSFKKSKGRKFN